MDNNNFELINKKLEFLKNKNILSLKHTLKIKTFFKSIAHKDNAKILQEPYKPKNILYHSTRDPVKEAQRQLYSIPLLPKNNILIYISCGLGYMLPLALNYFKIQKVILIETHIETLAHLVLLQNWEDISFLNKLHILYLDVDDLEEDIEELYPLVKTVSQNNIFYYMHKPAFMAFPKMYTQVKEKLISTFEIRKMNQQTLTKFQDLWNINIINNALAILQGFKLNDFISHIKENFKNLNIIIVGAGPSLEKNINDLKKYREKYLLFCVDTAYLPLIKNHIIPDVVFTSDPQFINHHYSMSKWVGECIWCLDPVVTYHTVHHLERLQAPMVWWNNPFILDQLLQKYTSNRGEVKHGGSISTNAFDVAIQIQPDHLILIGHDLCFSNKKAHVKGSIIEESMFFQTNRFYHFEDYNYKQMTALPPIMVKTNQSKQTYTNAKMQAFIDWFQHVHQKYNIEKTTLWNATYEGVVIQPFEVTALATFFKQGSFPNLTNKNKIFSKFFISLEKHTVLSGRDSLFNEISNLLNNLKSIKKILAENINLYFSQQNVSLLSQLDKNDLLISKYPLASKFLSLNNQADIFDITEGNIDQKNSLDVSLKFYKKMLKSAKYSIYILYHLQNILKK